MTDADLTQTGWDAESRIARVTRIEAQIRLIDTIQGELRRAKLSVTCLSRRLRESKWELDRLMVNLAILAPAPSPAPPAANGDQAGEQARPAAGRRRKPKEVE